MIQGFGNEGTNEGLGKEEALRNDGTIEEQKKPRQRFWCWIHLPR